MPTVMQMFPGNGLSPMNGEWLEEAGRVPREASQVGGAEGMPERRGGWLRRVTVRMSRAA
jgi:hypothetical protein